MKGAIGIERLSLKRLSGEGLKGGVSFAGDPGILRKALDMGISFHRGHCTAVGNLESEMGLIYRGLQKMDEGGL